MLTEKIGLDPSEVIMGCSEGKFDGQEVKGMQVGVVFRLLPSRWLGIGQEAEKTGADKAKRVTRKFPRSNETTTHVTSTSNRRPRNRSREESNNK